MWEVISGEIAVFVPVLVWAIVRFTLEYTN